MSDDRRAALELLFREAKDYVRYQFETVQDLEDKAGQIIRFDAVVAGIVVASLSFGIQPGAIRLTPTDAAFFAVSLAVLVGSMAFAVLAFVRSDVAVGLRHDTLIQARSYDVGPRDLLEEAVVAYTTAIGRNNRSAIRPTGQLVNAAAALLLASVAILALEATRLMGMFAHG